MDWSMGAVWWASAHAVELSERTLAATAALMGAARLAFTSDMASRSGRASAFSASSSSSVSCFSTSFAIFVAPFSVSSLEIVRSDALIDRCVLRCVGGGCCTVGQHVGGDRGVDRNCDVGVDERHGLPVGELLAVLFHELLLTQAALNRFLRH